MAKAVDLFEKFDEFQRNFEFWMSLPYTQMPNDTPGDDVIYGTETGERFGGNEGSDTIYGLDGNDYLEGGNAVDYLYGGAGADMLDPGNEQDYSYGGPGDDYYLIYAAGAPAQDILSEVPGEGFDWVISSQDGYRLPANIEGLLLHIDGGGGVAYQGYGNDLDNVIRGQSLDNRIWGMAGNDLLLGLGGNDTFDGGSGDDWIDGGADNDTVEYLGKLSDYSITGGIGGSWVVRDINLADGDDGADNLISIENVKFADATITGLGIPPPLNSIDWGTQIANPTQITVYFAGLGEEYGGTISSGWGSIEKAAFAAAFATIEAVTNVKFVEVTDPATATLKLVTSADLLPDSLGNFGPPGSQNAGIGRFFRFGDGWDFIIGAGLEPGGLGFRTIMHELGHALGLAHPHDTGGTSAIMQGVTSAFGSYGDFLLNQGVYTMMSYNRGWSALVGNSTPNEVGPMALDIAVLQAKYGVVAANTDNTTYLLPAPDDADAAFRCIWDTGGIDTIASNGDASCVIDLRAATLDYSPGGGGRVSYMAGRNGGVTIAAGVRIENAQGGAHDDVLFGNDLANVLAGGGGADRLHGGGGNDTFVVDRQDDLVFEIAGEGTDTIESSASFYLYDNVENLVLVAGAGDIFGVGNALANRLTGNSGANLLIGGAGDDIVSGGGGDDQLFGGDQADTLSGDAGTDYLAGGIGNDTLGGGADADSIYGEDGEDYLDGGTSFHTDILVGGAGNDTLYGISGQANPDYDLMDGGAGDDIYHVDTGADLTFEAVGGGTDTVIANVTVANAGVYLYANVENLVLAGTTSFGVGNDLNNQLTGSASGNWLLGGAGNDRINGAAGNDVLFGESGADSFVFDFGSGADVIGDFNLAEDVIEFLGIFTSFVQAQANFVQVGSDGAIDLGNGNLIVLHGVTMANLTAANFIFAPAAEAPSAASKQVASIESHSFRLEALDAADYIDHGLSRWMPGLHEGPVYG